MEPKQERPDIATLLRDNIIIPKTMLWRFFVRQLIDQIQPQLSLKRPPLFKVCPNFHSAMQITNFKSDQKLSASVEILPTLIEVIFGEFNGDIILDTPEKIKEFLGDKCQKSFHHGSIARVSAPAIIRKQQKNGREYMEIEFTYELVNASGVVQ